MSGSDTLYCVLLNNLISQASLCMRVETRTRKRMYDHHTGSGYEAARYGDPYKEQYRKIRNEVLVDLISENYR